METVSLSVKRRILFPSQFRVVFTRVWVNIVPSAGDISNCRLDLSVGPIYRRQSRLRSHAIIDIHRVSRPGQPALSLRGHSHRDRNNNWGKSSV